MSGLRVLRIDLGALEGGWSPRPGAPAFRGSWSTLASWGGSALGLACLEAEARRESTTPSSLGPLILAAGEAVQAGLPTAARAAVLAHAPLSGRTAEGHVGGELGARLARLTDALVLVGRCTRAGGVLVLEEDGSVALLARPELCGSAPEECARALERELGPAAVLAIGVAGERGLPFASLAAGHSPPSFVGRGGLGAVLGALGLKALVVRARPAPGSVPRAESAALVARLSASPRLAARAAGGTLELFDVWAARGALESALGHGLAREARASAESRHGCRGCPTPCGWVFERSDGGSQGARFGASHALGSALGLEHLDDALFLLGECDRLGIDAKEVGALLALRATAEERGLLAGPPARGRAALVERITALVEDEGAPGRAGVARLAEALGLEHEVPTSHGQAVRPESDRASLLGQCVASGGADPMRSFPFLLESADLERLRALLAPLELPVEALDGSSGRAKGRLVFWHENLVSAVDMSGFCAFSAAGLIADGLCDLDELARWILPEALRAPADPEWAALAPGARLLAAGANLVLARHACNQAFGAPGLTPPPFARAALAEAGMLDEYLVLRGLDARGRPTEEARSAFGTPRVLALGRARLETYQEPAPAPSVVAPPAVSTSAPRRARVTLRASGSLALVLGESRALELPLPSSVRGVLRAALETSAGGTPELAASLFRGEALVPAVWRAGRRLLPDDRVEAGDVLELVTAISGG